jgi:hypothetical protein
VWPPRFETTAGCHNFAAIIGVEAAPVYRERTVIHRLKQERIVSLIRQNFRSH